MKIGNIYIISKIISTVVLTTLHCDTAEHFLICYSHHAGGIDSWVLRCAITLHDYIKRNDSYICILFIWWFYENLLNHVWFVSREKCRNYINALSSSTIRTTARYNISQGVGSNILSRNLVLKSNSMKFCPVVMELGSQ